MQFLTFKLPKTPPKTPINAGIGFVLMLKTAKMNA